MAKTKGIHVEKLAARKDKNKTRLISEMIAASRLSKSLKVTENGEELDGGHLIIKIGGTGGSKGRLRSPLKKPTTQQPPWHDEMNMMIELPPQQLRLLKKQFKASAKNLRKMQKPKWKD